MGRGSDLPRPQVVVGYEYRDEHGDLQFVVERLEPKTFRQKRPDGQGGWIYNRDGGRAIPYRLADLVRILAQAGDSPPAVYVTEGEKDADTLWAQGLAATTNPGGAGKWRPEYSSILQKVGVRQVIILPDNDPPGAAHAGTVAASCCKVGLLVKIVNLPGLPGKGDVADWLADGHGTDELLALVQATPDTCADGDEASTAAGPVLLPLSDVTPEEISWLWPGRLARGKLTLIIGDPGLGKTYLTQEIAAQLSVGGKWPDGGRVCLGTTVLLSAEDAPADSIRPRVDALGGDATRIHLLRAVRDAAGHEHGLTLARDVHHLETAIDRCDADLVVIDPISAYLGEKDAYKDAEVRALLAPLVTLAERTRVAVVAIAHLTKDSQRRAIHRALNSVAFVAAARIVLAVGLDPDDDASDVDTKRRVFLHVKNNLTHAPPALAFRTTPTFAWEPGTLTGLNADAVLGAPLTTGEEREEGLDADALLRELLALGERPASEIFQAAKANGIAERTLYRAKRRLGIKTRHEGQPGKKGGSWHWSFPVSPTSNV